MASEKNSPTRWSLRLSLKSPSQSQVYRLGVHLFGSLIVARVSGKIAEDGHQYKGFSKIYQESPNCYEKIISKGV